MTSPDPPDAVRQQLLQRLEEAAAVVEALEKQEVDAVVGRRGVALLRLKEVEEELRRGYRDLEHELELRTAEVRRRAAQLQALALQLTEAEEQERRRLAVVLHDGLQQQLVAMRLHLEVLARHVDAEAAQPSLTTLRGLVDGAIASSRSLSMEISPQVLYHEGLPAALAWLAEDFGTKHRLAVDLELEARADVRDERLRVFFFQAAREALFNVVKHAGVDRAQVTLSADDGEVLMTVADCGCGFDPESLLQEEKATGLGLVSVRERGELLGVEVEMESVPQDGTRVTVRWRPASPLLP